MDSLSYPITILTLVFSFLLYKLWRIKNPNHKTKGILAPEPSGALPIIGHLHLLGGQVPLAHILASLADKYGPIFTIHLEAYPALVVSNQETIKDCFTTNDKALASHPNSSQGIHLGYNYAAFAFTPNNSYWRKIRKITTLELLSPRQIESLRHVYSSEIDTFTNDLYMYLRNKASVKVVITEWFERLTFNVSTKMVAGKRYFDNLQDVNDEESHRVRKLIKDFMHIAGEFVPSKLIPFLGWLNFEGQVLKSMKRIAQDLDSLVASWVEEHATKRQRNESSEKQDFIDVMLSVIEDDPTLGYTRDTIIKATVVNLILAGADTTSITVTWMLALLLKNRQALKRAQEEIDLHVGKERRVDTSDIKNLVYLQAVFKETLRLYPATPLLLPHEATKDCYICGYFVPRGTRVFANVWKLHRDPKIWPQPERFLPERFIIETVNVDEGGHFKYLPFGFGRRACSGSTFAMQVSLLTIARLLQGFEIEVPLKDEPTVVDMREGIGLTLPKATPLEVLLTPRLPSQHYHI